MPECLRNWELETALLSLAERQVGQWHGVLIHRLDRFNWSVGRGPAQRLLPAVDALARAAGWRADGRGEAHR